MVFDFSGKNAAFMQVPQDYFHSPWVQILSNKIKAPECGL
jgi:hypothetical protein